MADGATCGLAKRLHPSFVLTREREKAGRTMWGGYCPCADRTPGAASGHREPGALVPRSLVHGPEWRPNAVFALQPAIAP